MPTFDTPGLIAATVVVAGAQVRVTASDRTDTVVLVEPIDKASKKDVKVANNTMVGISEGTAARVDANSERGSVRNSVPSQENPDTSDNKVTVHARTRHGDIIIQRAAN